MNRQELRRMSIKDTLRVVGDLIELYKERLYSGTIAVDVRSGKPIWVRPVITDSYQDECRNSPPDVMKQLAETLNEFETSKASGEVSILVCLGKPVEVSRSVELEKVRVG